VVLLCYASARCRCRAAVDMVRVGSAMAGMVRCATSGPLREPAAVLLVIISSSPMMTMAGWDGDMDMIQRM
jgi:hypothetical protein